MPSPALKVLVVDDDAEVRALHATVVRTRGHAVTLAEDKASALEAFRAERHPLVLLDWMLGEDDGLDVLAALRGLPGGDDTVVLMVTSMSEPAHLRTVLDAGADDYLAKPVDPSLLQVRLAVAESRVQLRAERRSARVQLTATLEELRRSHDDLTAILDQLRAGTLMTDAQGRVSYLSRTARRMLGVDAAAAQSGDIYTLLPIAPAEREALEEMTARAPAQREKLVLRLGAQAQAAWVEVDVEDDPRDPQRKIYFLYDVSDLHSLRKQLSGKAELGDLVGGSAAMKRVYAMIENLARVDSTVVIEGETGTGKELVARAIHDLSHRKDKPFIAINCGGLSESLLDSQLFGHRRGAFTGAIADQKGVFETADGGTLLLDEIGDVPAKVQTSLLRVLQEREIVRLGETQPRKIDVRVICATHRNLQQEVDAGTFRADLLYRIRVGRINLPPLRERREDIPRLAEHLLRLSCATSGKEVAEITPEALRMVMAYRWPGNVRELRGAIEYAVIGAQDDRIVPMDLPPELHELSAPASVPVPALPEIPGEDERERIQAALDMAGGNRSKAAKLLGISRATFYRRLDEFGM